MLLPGLKVLQLANCHKYVTRRDNKAYAEIYTTTTIKGQCPKVDKILVIWDGFKGGFHNATIDEVVNAIIKSNLSLTGNKKVAFDTCYAGYSDATVTSAVHGVKDRLKAKKLGVQSGTGRSNGVQRDDRGAWSLRLSPFCRWFRSVRLWRETRQAAGHQGFPDRTCIGPAGHDD